VRITEFAINLFQRYAPVASDSMGELKLALGNNYQKILSEMETKENKNKTIEQKADKISKELDELDVHSPEYEKKVIEFEQLHDELESKTVMEKVVSFLEKPMTRLVIMVLFIVASRWIAKKITEKKEDKSLDDEMAEQPNFQQQYYQQPPNWQPFGQGYGYPPQSQNGFGFPPQSRK